MPKDMSAKSSSPLEQLLGGRVIISSEKGTEQGRGPFIEVLEDGWTVLEPNDLGLDKAFAGVNFEEKLMVVPTDETRGALMTRIHEMGHTVYGPHTDLPELELKSGIPASVLNAFEDGRVNGKLRQDVPVFDEAIHELEFPISIDALKKAVKVNTAERERGITNTFTDNEVRAFGACLMAASEVYSPESTGVWESIADATLMTAEQKRYVIEMTHRLPSLSYEQMVEEIQHLMNLLVEELTPPPLPTLPVPVEGTAKGYGPLTEETQGTDHEEEDSGTKANEEYDRTVTTVTKVERPKPKPLPPSATKSLDRVGSRAALVNTMGPRTANQTAVSHAKEVAKTITAPEYRARTISQYHAHREEAKRTDAADAAVAAVVKATIKGESLTKDYGVSPAEEAHVAARFGGEGVWKRPEMRHREFPLEEQVVSPIGNPRRAKKHDRVGYMTSPWRAHIDGRVFRRKMRVRRLQPAGAILLDLSGSMSPSSKLIRRCLEIAPYAIVGAYAGNDSGRGSFAVVAHNRKCVSQSTLQEIISEFGGGNSVDYEALEWLAQQPGPRIWISDGWVCGSGSHDGKNAHLCFQLAREKEIIRIPDLRMLVGERPLKNNLSGV